MPKARMVVHAAVIDREMSVWCGQCFLPSAVVATIAVDIDGHPQDLLRLAFCPECGQQWRAG